MSVYPSRRSPVTIIVAYCRPTPDLVSFVDYPDGVLNNLSPVAVRKVCLVGDFNAKRATRLPSQDTDAAGTRLHSYAAMNGLSQTVSEPTYSSMSGRNVLLDLMFTNQPDLVLSCRV